MRRAGCARGRRCRTIIGSITSTATPVCLGVSMSVCVCPLIGVEKRDVDPGAEGDASESRIP